jgi:hypothetical protein
MILTFVRRMVLFCLVAVLSLTGSAAAQDYWMYPGGMNSVSLQIFKPGLAEHSSNYGLLTSTWVVSTRFDAGSNTAFFVSLPVSNAVMDFEWSYLDHSAKQTVIGNPYIGFEFGSWDTLRTVRPLGRVGFRIPIASDDKDWAASIGHVTLFNSFESMIPELWTIQVGMGVDLVSRTGLAGSINVDVATMIPNEGGDSEIFGNFGLTLIYASRGFSGSIGYAGRVWLSEGDMSLSERTVDQLGFETGYRIGSFRPGAHLRLPLDENLSDEIDNIYGLSLTYFVK